MPKTKRTTSTKSKNNGGPLGFEEKLWAAADKMRGHMDAAEYKHVVLGLLFLKYVSDAFESRREALKIELEQDGIAADQIEPLLESRDEYTAEHVFWVPPESRWPNLQAQAVQPNIATLLDDAILAVERDNPNLKGKLLRDYARRGIPPEKLCGLINLVSDIGFKGDRANPPPDSDIGRIVYTFRRWRGEPQPVEWDEVQHGSWAYTDVSGFCKAATLSDVEKHGFVLMPGRYVGAEEMEDDGEQFEVKYPRLLTELETRLAEGERLAAVVRKKLGGVQIG